MTETIHTKVLVVGGGPGGYVAAIRAGQLGLDTTIVEGDALGGACLNRGCIPSKALIHAAEKFADTTKQAAGEHLGISVSGKVTLDLAKTMKWKDGVVGQLNRGVGSLLKRAKVRVVQGWAEFSDAKTCKVGDQKIVAEHVILATGSLPVQLPKLPWSKDVVSSTEMLALDKLPAKVAIIGGGYIGLELGLAFRKFGSEVTVVEARDRLLPLYDNDLVKPLAKSVAAHGIEVHLNTLASGFANGKLTAEKDGKSFEIAADKVLVTAGRRPRTNGFGLERMGVDMNGAFVKIDDQCHTSMKNVWAIGDLVGEPMLAHKASAQGIMVAEIISGQRRRFDPACIPAICFTDPEIVSVGMSPAAAKEKGIETIVSNFPLAANGRALTLEAAQSGGFVRVTAAKADHRILGLDAVGPGVSELSGEMVALIEMGATMDDASLMIHAHPTLSETFHEVSALALGHPVHF